VAKLMALVQVLCHLAGLRSKGGAAAAAADGALHALLMLLVNKYPKVRKYAAEQLYVRLLTLGGDDDGDGDADEQTEVAMEVLSGTRWDADVGVVKAARARLYAPLKLTPPVLKAKREGGDGVVKAGAAADEHASYASLVDTAGY